MWHLADKGQQRYSTEVQQRPLPATSIHDRQHTELAGTTAKRPAPSVVRDEEARARRVPDEVVDRGSPRSPPDNTASTATWLDARDTGREGDLTRKRSAAKATQVHLVVVPTERQPGRGGYAR